MMAMINNATLWLLQNKVLFISYMIDIAVAIIIIIGGIVSARIVSRGFNRGMLARHIDKIVIDFISALIRYGIIIFTLIAALGRIGIQTASVITVLSAAGLAVSLALQGSLANLAAGLLLVTFRPFRAGEYVSLEKTTGTVLSIQIFSTTLRSSDGTIVIVPNKKVVDGNIINFSREPVRRNEFIVKVSYDSDIALVKKILTNIIKSDERILKNHEMTVRLNKLDTMSVNFVVRVWSKSIDLQNVYWDILERIKHNFDVNGINFIYLQPYLRSRNQVKEEEE